MGVAGNILLGVSLAAPIGPAGIAVIQNGLKRGFLQAFLTGIGVTAADATYLLLVHFGLAGFIHIPVVKVLIWTLGTVVLLFLGYQSIRDGISKPAFERAKASVSRNPLLAGYLINISNPVAVVWWLGIFGSLLGTSAAGSTRTHALCSSSTILIGILTWHSAMSLLTHWGRRYLNEKTAKVITVVAGIALVLFGIRFGFNAAAALTARIKI